MVLEFYGYPPDFLERYRTGIEKVTVEDLQRVARKFIRPEELAVLVVGKEADFDKSLSTRGEVNVIDITIPEPGASTAKPAAAVATTDEGRALLRKMKEFLGGAAVDGLRAMRTTAEIEANTPGGTMQIRQTTTVDIASGRVHRLMQTPMGEMQIALSDAGSFVRGPMGVQDLPASQSKAMREELWIDPVYLARNAEAGNVGVSRSGSETISGVEAAKLDVDAAGAKVTLWVDPATGQPLRRARSSMAMGQKVEESAEFTDWKAAGGIRYASKVVITSNGETQAQVSVTSFEPNPEIDEKLFIK